MKQKELKEKMPETAAFLAQLVEAFGADAIHSQVRAGLAGEPVFWAKENGNEIGTKVNLGGTCEISWDPVTDVAMEREIKRDRSN